MKKAWRCIFTAVFYIIEKKKREKEKENCYDYSSLKKWHTFSEILNIVGLFKDGSYKYWYLSYAPPEYEYGTRPFLRWVRSQGRYPDASSSPKNASGPVGIPLFGAPQAPGDTLNLSTAGQSVYHQLDLLYAPPAYDWICYTPDQRTTGFVIPSTSVRLWCKAVFREVRSQGRNPDTSGNSKNASGPVSIPFLGCLRCQAINLIPPRRD